MPHNIKYDERLIVFIDILGFKNIISKSVDDEDLLSFIYQTISRICGDSLEVDAYNNIQYLPAEEGERENELPVIYPDHPEFDSKARNKWPISVTHFSDCIIMSASVEINGSCQLMLRTLNELMFSLFDRGILTRGGLSIGKIIHESNGILFDPGLIESYILESEKAKYPRIVVSHKSREAFKKLLYYTYLELFKESSDGYYATNVTHVIKYKLLNQGEFSFDYTDSKINKIRDSVSQENPNISRKVEYLSKQWEMRKLEILEEIGIGEI